LHARLKLLQLAVPRFERRMKTLELGINPVGGISVRVISDPPAPMITARPCA
jgi:hypothetical protein